MTTTRIRLTLDAATIDHQHHTGQPDAHANPGDTYVEVTLPSGHTETIDIDTAATWADAITDALHSAHTDPKEAAADDAGDPTDDPKE